MASENELVSGGTAVMFRDAQKRAVHPLVNADGSIATSPGADAGVKNTAVSGSGTIATLDVAQDVFPANANRKGMEIQNVSDTDMWFNELNANAVKNQPSYKLAPGASYYWNQQTGFVPLARLSIICGAAGKAFTAREW